MNQSKTEMLIDFWEHQAEYYERKHYVSDVERCLKHVKALIREA